MVIGMSQINVITVKIPSELKKKMKQEINKINCQRGEDRIKNPEIRNCNNYQNKISSKNIKENFFSFHRVNCVRA